MQEIRTADRWLGAVCYLNVFVLVPVLFQKSKSGYLARHCRQGFALLILEMVSLLLIYVIEGTLGRIPVLGLLLEIVVNLAAAVGFLALSLIGFLKALGGEEWRIPGIDELADRIPIN